MSEKIADVARLPSYCPPEIAEQFHEMLGEDYHINDLIQGLKEKPLFPDARHTIQSFVPDLDVREAQRATWANATFYPRCEADTCESNETSDYEIELDGSPADFRVKVGISPNALKVLFSPVQEIMQDLVEGKASPAEIRDRSIIIAYRGLFAGNVAQFATKRHLMKFDQQGFEGYKDEVIQKIDPLYETSFPTEKSNDQPTKLNRLAMAIGGAVMLRHVTVAIARYTESESKNSVGYPLKMYALGLAQQKPVDRKRASFAMANAFDPQSAAAFMKMWFGDIEKDGKQHLRLV